MAAEYVIYHNPRCRKTIAEYPKLLERPVVVKGKRAVLGRPPEKIRELL